MLRSPSTNTVQSSALPPIPLTTYPGVEFAPSFSPSGNEIAFEWHQESTPHADLYVKQIGQENPVRLTYHHAGFLEPAWSPDGKKIAFVMVTKDGVGVYVLPPFGGTEHRLADLGKRGYPYSMISWSPDSKWIAFAKGEESGDPAHPGRFLIHLIHAETTEEHVLPQPAPDCALMVNPSISPDGTQIASVCLLIGGEGTRLYVQPADGSSNDIRLIANPPSIDSLTWARDGKSLLYSGSTNLWRVPVNGGTPEKLSFAHDAMGPAVSRSGNKLAYIQCNTYHAEIFEFGLSGRGKAPSTATRVASSTRGQLSPRVSPNGKRIAFQSDRSGSMEIWMANRDGSNPVQLSALGVRSGTPRWSPDSKSIVFDSLASGRSEIYTVKVDGGVPRKLSTGTANASLPFWSSDGHTIFFSTEHPLAIWKVPASGGSAVQMTKEGRYLPQESADGKRLYYVVSKQPTEIWSVPVEGGEERAEKGMFAGILDAAWVPAAHGLYFIAGFPQQYSVGFFDAITHRVKKIADLPKLAELQGGIALAPDGRSLLYAGVERSEADIMLVENFR